MFDPLFDPLWKAPIAGDTGAARETRWRRASTGRVGPNFAKEPEQPNRFEHGPDLVLAYSGLLRVRLREFTCDGRLATLPLDTASFPAFGGKSGGPPWHQLERWIVALRAR